MGGKKKDGNRTKGNLKPASSGKAAQILEAKGQMGFIGFSTFSSGDVSQSGVLNAAALAADCPDGEVRMIMRRLAKRDSTTKLKALDSYRELCTERDVEVAVESLNYFPRLYTKLALDGDRRVRENSQAALSVVVSKVGRNLAPFLKQLIGTWLLSFCDPYAPAATEARSAFSKAFPEAKQDEVLNYCQNEILRFLVEMLFNSTPQTLSDPSTTSDVEMTEKYERVISTSLNCLSMVINMYPSSGLSSLEAKVSDEVLSQSAFWKFGNHENPMIRSSYYMLLGAICLQHTDLANKVASKLCPAVLGKLNDSDSVVCPKIWEAAVQTVANIQEFWKSVSIKKCMLPSLWSALKKGFDGNAVLVAPKLVTFLNKIITAVSDMEAEFYNLFFSNLKLGVSAERVRSSKREVNAILKTFTECLMFVINRCVEGNDVSTALEVTETHLISLLDESLFLESSTLSGSSLYGYTCDLTVALKLKSSRANEKRMSEGFDSVRQLIWDSMIRLSKKTVLEESDSPKRRFLQLITSFISQAKPEESLNSRSATASVGRSVVFGIASSSNIMQQKTTTKLRADHPEYEKVVELSSLTCSRCLSSPSKDNIRTAKDVTELTGSTENFFISLARALKCDDIKLLISYCIKLLSDHDLASESRDHITYIAVSATQYCYATACHTGCDGECSDGCLVATLQQLSQATTISSVLKLSLDCTWLESSVQQWLSSQSFTDRLSSLANQIAKSSSAEGRRQKVQPALDIFILLLDSDLSLGERITSLCHYLHTFILESICQTRDVDLLTCYSSYLTLCHKLELPADTCHTTALTLLNLVISDEFNSSTTASLVTVCQLSLDKLTSVQVIQVIIRICGMSNSLQELRRLVVTCQELSLPDSFLSDFIDEVVKELNNTKLLESLAISSFNGKLPVTSLSKDSHICCKQADLVREIPRAIKCILYTADFVQETGQSHTDSEQMELLITLCAVVNSWLTLILESFSFSQSPAPSNIGWLSPDSRAIVLKMIEHCCTERDRERTLQSLMAWQNSEKGNSRLWRCLSVAELASSLSEADSLSELSQKTLENTDLSNSSDFYTLYSMFFHIKNTEVVESLLEVVSSLLISLDTSDSSYETGTKYTNTLQIVAVLISRLGEDDSCYNTVLSILDVITNYVKTVSTLLLITDQSPELDDRLLFNISVMRYFTAVVQYCPTKLSSEHWDFLLCTVDSWFGDNNCVLPSKPSTYTELLYVSSLTALLNSLGHMVRNRVTASPGDFPKDFLAEWVELHALTIYKTFLPYFVDFACHMGRKEPSLQQTYALNGIARAVVHCPDDSIKNHSLPVKLVPDHQQNLPLKLETSLNHVIPLLLSGNRCVQSAAYILLNKIVSTLPQYDTAASQPSEDEELSGGGGRCPQEALVSTINTCSIGQILGGFRIGIDERLGAASSDHNELMCFRAHLLTWSLLLKYLQYSTSEQMAEYSLFLKKHGYVEELLLAIFYILPLEDNINTEVCKYNISLDLSEVGCKPHTEVISTAFSVYYRLIKVLPAMVRSWHMNLEKKASGLVDRFTSKYISPRLCTDELEQLQSGTTFASNNNLTVKVRPVAREAIAMYTLDEFSIELVITLPTNYPIGQTSVDCSKKLGVATSEWRKWMLQLTTFLMHQNGSLASAISLWKRNLDKKFEGIEECYICFSVLHGTNLQIPKQQCKTCRKKFHSACLYKWFTSSQKSSCPLCRNLF